MNQIAAILGNKVQEGMFWTHSKQLVSGCTKVSPGCANCWSEAMARRFGGMVDESGEFDGTIKEHPERLDGILPKSGRRKARVWTYWNDLFHGCVTGAFQDRLFDIISQSTDYHIICTKRPRVALEYLRQANRRNSVLSNVIILVTMEDQTRADLRLPTAAQISALGWKVGALCEPMLTPIDLMGEWGACMFGNGPIRKRWIDALSWIICGPENGHNKRPFDERWAVDLRDQTWAAGLPFFYKAGLLNGHAWTETP